MDYTDIDMDEFLCFKEKTAEDDKYFSREKILKLLELYKKYHKRLGSYEVKSKKKLWEIIAMDLSNEFKITIAPNKCENKFKVLERNYKKCVDNNNQTGSSRKTCEYEQELDDIFEKKKSINPVLLLSSCSSSKKLQALPNDPVPVISILEAEPGQSCSYTMDTQHEGSETTPAVSVHESRPTVPIHEATPKVTQKCSLKRRRIPHPVYRKRNDILQEMQNDLKKYYEKKERREEEKLKIAKQRQAEREKRNQMAREYLNFLKKTDE